MDPGLETDQLGAALEHQILAKAVAAVHLERDPAEIAKPLLAQAEERPALASQLARRGRGAPPRRRRRHHAWSVAVTGRPVRSRALPQQASEQR